MPRIKSTQHIVILKEKYTL